MTVFGVIEFAARLPSIIATALSALALARALPPHSAVLRSSTSVPTLQEVVLFGPTPAPRLAADGRPASRP